MTKDIIPCPFCGGTRIDFRDVDTTKWGSAYCVECLAKGPEVRTDYDMSKDAEWHKRAIEEWNKRAQSKDEEIERRKKCL